MRLSFLAVTSTLILLTGSLHAELKTSSTPRLGVKGYCIVCVVEAKRWVKGKPEYPVTFDGMTYLFPGTESRNLFTKNPAKYAPVLGGDSVVAFAKTGKRVPGSVRFATLHKKRVYLFRTSQERAEFRSNLTKYETADIAMSGYCPVCHVDGGKKVAGKRNISTTYCGMRYFFPGENEKTVFLRNPGKYIHKDLPKASTRSNNKVTHTSKTSITITGKTGCAACEHGVHPIGAPDELGLAVIDSKGRVFVVEDAHKLYPKLYENRFDGHPVKLNGRVIKSVKGVTWVSVDSLIVSNSRAET